MKKAIISLLICLFLLASCVKADENAVGPDIPFALPEGYEHVQSSENEVIFTKDDISYTLRFSRGEESPANLPLQNATDIHLAGNIPVYIVPGGPGMASWYADGYSYSLYTEKADGDLISAVIFDLARETEKQSGTEYKGLMKLWNVSLEGYSRISAYFVRNLHSKELDIYFQVCPDVYAQSTKEMEKVTLGERDFFIDDQQMCWDGIDSEGKWIGGTTYSRRIIWHKDGFAYSLSANTGDKTVSLDIISPQTAFALESDYAFRPKGFEPTNETWGVELRSGHITVTVALHPKPFDSVRLKEIEQNGTYYLSESNGTEIYIYRNERTDDDPNISELIWQTDLGLMSISGGIPYNYRNDYPEGVWDFINPELALNIAQQAEIRFK